MVRASMVSMLEPCTRANGKRATFMEMVHFIILMGQCTRSSMLAACTAGLPWTANSMVSFSVRTLRMARRGEFSAGTAPPSAGQIVPDVAPEICIPPPGHAYGSAVHFGAQEHHRILRYGKVCAYLSIVYERYGQEDFESGSGHENIVSKDLDSVSKCN
jgi:hypothetical protein